MDDLMRILLVYCHPVPESFCASIRDTRFAHAEQNGHEADLDLYAEGFDPVMPADERRGYNEMKLADHPFPAHAERLQAAEGCSSSIRPGGTGCRPCSRAGWTGSGPRI
jgi:NAD(P)H dehydrogenase (quinone)